MVSPLPATEPPFPAPTTPEAWAELAGQEQLTQVAELTLATALEAARGRLSRFPEEPLRSFKVPEDLRTLGDGPLREALDALRHGTTSRIDHQRLSALIAIGLRRDFPSAPETELATASLLLWLVTETPLDPFAYAEQALQNESKSLWVSLLTLATEPALRSDTLSGALALAAATVLRMAPGVSAKAVAAELDNEKYTSQLRWLRPHASRAPVALHGELGRAPARSAVTVLLALSLVLLVERLLHLCLRYLLGLRRPATLVVEADRVEVTSQLLLLGRVLRERRMMIPLTEVERVVREVRFARSGLYAGLVALILGTYLGVGAFIDGVRVPGGSASLVGIGLLLMLGGIVLDFALSSLTDSVRGRCRVIVVPRKGRALCVSGVERESADAVLKRVAAQAR